MDRRQFVAASIAALPGLAALPRVLQANTLAPRTLSFLHTHTGESLEVEYFSSGLYLPDALESVNHLLRDFRTGEVHAIDPGVLDILHDLTRMTGSGRPFQVISGYRSPRTNSMLRERSGGVAAKSLHMQGKAIDIRLADVPLSRLRDAALSLQRGGVGYYPGSNFVHVDTGRVRRW